MLLQKLLSKLEDPQRPLLGPTVKALKFLGILLPKNKFKRNLYLVLHFFIIFFIFTQFVDIYYIISNINSLIDNLKYSAMGLVTGTKILTFLYGQKRWIDILEYVTKTDLEQRKSLDTSKNKFIREYTNYCRKITYIYWFMMALTCIFLFSIPILKYTLLETYKENVKNGTEKYIEVLSSWVPFDKNQIKGYIAASVYQSSALFIRGTWIALFDANAFVIMVFFRAELEMLRMDSRKIFDSEPGNTLSDNENYMKNLKLLHQRYVDLVKYVKMFDTFLSPVMFVYFIVCSVVLCATAYQITIDTSVVKVLLAAEYLIFSLTQLFLYCWHSNEILCTSEDLRLGPYESAWYTNQKRLKDIYILTEQFKEKIVLTAGPFTTLTLPSFVAIIKGAYSYYALLSQMAK